MGIDCRAARYQIITVPDVVHALRPTIAQSTVLAVVNHGVEPPVILLKSPSALKMKSAIVVIATDDAIEGK